MKKLLSALVIAAMIAAIGIPALAAPNLNPNPGAVRPQGPANPDSVPVYGYIGPEIDVDDPDPDDPGINPFSLSVSVPVKLMWVAFVPEDPIITDDTTEVFAPDYKIINRTKKDVKLTVTGFEETSVDESNDPIELLDGVGYLDLQLTAAVSPDASVVDVKEVASIAGSPYLINDTAAMPFTFDDIDLGTIAAAPAGVDTNSSELWFTLTGAFSVDDGDSWPEETLLPQYLIKFKFEIVATP